MVQMKNPKFAVQGIINLTMKKYAPSTRANELMMMTFVCRLNPNGEITTHVKIAKNGALESGPQICSNAANARVIQIALHQLYTSQMNYFAMEQKLIVLMVQMKILRLVATVIMMLYILRNIVRNTSNVSSL
jgi:hypothetical protein